MLELSHPPRAALLLHAISERADHTWSTGVRDVLKPAGRRAACKGEHVAESGVRRELEWLGASFCGFIAGGRRVCPPADDAERRPEK